eukprot:12589137-Prorocentrum_lima.AAC.1
MIRKPARGELPKADGKRCSTTFWEGTQSVRDITIRRRRSKKVPKYLSLIHISEPTRLDVI